MPLQVLEPYVDFIFAHRSSLIAIHAIMSISGRNKDAISAVGNVFFTQLKIIPPLVLDKHQRLIILK